MLISVRLSNEKQNTHGVVYHFSFLFQDVLFSSLMTYHMNYQISVDSHDRLNTFLFD